MITKAYIYMYTHIHTHIYIHIYCIYTMVTPGPNSQKVRDVKMRRSQPAGTMVLHTAWGLMKQYVVCFNCCLRSTLFILPTSLSWNISSFLFTPTSPTAAGGFFFPSWLLWLICIQQKRLHSVQGLLLWPDETLTERRQTLGSELEGVTVTRQWECRKRNNGSLCVERSRNENDITPRSHQCRWCEGLDWRVKDGHLIILQMRFSQLISEAAAATAEVGSLFKYRWNLVISGWRSCTVWNSH